MACKSLKKRCLVKGIALVNAQHLKRSIESAAYWDIVILQMQYVFDSGLWMWLGWLAAIGFLDMLQGVTGIRLSHVR